MRITKEGIIQMAQLMPGNIVVYLAKDKLERIYYSEGIPALSGYSLEEYKEIKDEDAFQLLLESDRKIISKKVWECIDNHVDVNFTYRLNHKIKGYVWVNARAHVVGKLDDAPILVTTISNISEKTETYELLLDTSERIIYVCDKDSREILYGNKKFYEYIGMGRTEAVGKKCFEVICHKSPVGKGKLCGCIQAVKNKTIVSDYNSQRDMYFNIEGKEIDWCGHKAIVFFFYDITMQKKKEEEERLAYQRHVDAVLKMNPNAISTFRFNITQNICENGASNYPNILQLQEEGTVDGYVQTAIKLIPNKEEQEEFQRRFQRDRLLQCFSKGETLMSFRHSYRLMENEDRLLLSTVDMVRNPLTGDVEGVVYAVDITNEYYETAIHRLLLEQEYEGIGIIDVRNRKLTMKNLTFGNREDLMQKGNDYDEGCKKAAQLFVFSEDKNLFLKNTSINHLVEQLSKNSSYFFTLYGKGAKGRKVLRKFSYYYMDERQDIILSTIEDVTKVLDHDVLTGEYNRPGFINYVTQILNNSKSEENFSILFMNIRGFKAINELFGVEGGDYVLRQSPELLRESSLNPVVIARFEADHFVMLVRREDIDFEEITRLCHREIDLNGKHFKFYGRCGIFHIIDKTRSVSGMCDRAKLAKDYITDEYVQPYAVFDSSMKEAFIAKRQLTSELEHALENREFQVYYQPIYDVKTGKIASAEALVRWIHPSLGVVSPGMFIPTFEENGYISELDLFVEKTVKNFLEKRYREKQKIVPVAVNLSRMDFYDDQMLEKIIEDVERTSLPDWLPRFEVTESAYSAMIDHGSNVLNALKKLGANILIDDFGSGYSSFSSIKDFDFDIIKLDMGFVQQIGINDKAEWILDSIIQMAHHINVKVIAEGAETKAQVDFLASLGCDYIQGFYYSKPLPEKEFVKLLNDSKLTIGE